MMKTVGRSILVALLVGLGGIFFSNLFADFFNGLTWEIAYLSGMILYLCIVLVVCTGVVIFHVNKTK